MEIEFSWDPEKAKRNRAKHRVSFQTASEVFFDPNVVIFEDCIIDGELRYLAIGYTRSQNQLLVVAFADRSADDKETIHIISAREAERYEQTTYSDQFA